MSNAYVVLLVKDGEPERVYTSTVVLGPDSAPNAVDEWRRVNTGTYDRQFSPVGVFEKAHYEELKVQTGLNGHELTRALYTRFYGWPPKGWSPAPAASAPSPRKPPPALPVEVHNTKPFDAAAAWAAIEQLSKGA